VVASIRKIRGRDGRRRDSAVRRRGMQGQSRDECARCATSRSSETGSEHESSGSAWIDWKVRVCAMRNLGI
jgi:transposase-like protein